MKEAGRAHEPSTFFLCRTRPDPALWTGHCHVTPSVTIETAVCLYVNISMTSRLTIASLCIPLPLRVRQPVTPPAGNLTSKERARRPLTPARLAGTERQTDVIAERGRGEETVDSESRHTQMREAV